MSAEKENFFVSGGVFPLFPEILQYYTMIPQRPRIIVGDSGYEPGTSAPEVWRPANEPPHLLLQIFLATGLDF